MSEDTKTYLTLDEEWPLELGEEVANPSRDRLPIVPDRVELAELFATEDELEQLAFRTLYESGLREAEFLALSREQLHEDFLDVAGRKALIGQGTMAQLHQLTNEGSLFGWEQAELRKRLRARARKRLSSQSVVANRQRMRQKNLPLQILQSMSPACNVVSFPLQAQQGATVGHKSHGGTGHQKQE